MGSGNEQDSQQGSLRETHDELCRAEAELDAVVEKAWIRDRSSLDDWFATASGLLEFAPQDKVKMELVQALGIPKLQSLKEADLALQRWHQRLTRQLQRKLESVRLLWLKTPAPGHPRGDQDAARLQNLLNHAREQSAALFREEAADVEECVGLVVERLEAADWSAAHENLTKAWTSIRELQASVRRREWQHWRLVQGLTASVVLIERELALRTPVSHKDSMASLSVGALVMHVQDRATMARLMLRKAESRQAKLEHEMMMCEVKHRKAKARAVAELQTNKTNRPHVHAFVAQLENSSQLLQESLQLVWDRIEWHRKILLQRWRNAVTWTGSLCQSSSLNLLPTLLSVELPDPLMSEAATSKTRDPHEVFPTLEARFRNSRDRLLDDAYLDVPEMLCLEAVDRKPTPRVSKSAKLSPPPPCDSIHSAVLLRVLRTREETLDVVRKSVPNDDDELSLLRHELDLAHVEQGAQMLLDHALRKAVTDGALSSLHVQQLGAMPDCADRVTMLKALQARVAKAQFLETRATELVLRAKAFYRMVELASTQEAALQTHTVLEQVVHRLECAHADLKDATEGRHDFCSRHDERKAELDEAVSNQEDSHGEEARRLQALRDKESWYSSRVSQQQSKCEADVKTALSHLEDLQRAIQWLPEGDDVAARHENRPGNAAFKLHARFLVISKSAILATRTAREHEERRDDKALGAHDMSYRVSTCDVKVKASLCEDEARRFVAKEAAKREQAARKARKAESRRQHLEQREKSWDSSTLIEADKHGRQPAATGERLSQRDRVEVRMQRLLRA